jgi:type II secretory pathway predicted ATPase ExeA
MRDRQLLSLYSLKYDPFRPTIPPENLWHPPESDAFFTRVETLVGNGGFALITGEPGLGKSKVLQLLDRRLGLFDEATIGVMEHPRSSLSDFYRELGAVFGVPLSVANRYGGFQALRARWREHIKSTLLRPVLLIDEAQEVGEDCLNELRILCSARFDSECLLTTVLCGDDRLPERFRQRELLPLGSRIMTRYLIEPYTPAELMDFLDHALEQAGNPHLMSKTLKETLCEHAAGNLRMLCNMGHNLLMAGCERELTKLDEKLFFEIFAQRRPRN